jgi:hypothetical protein
MPNIDDATADVTSVQGVVSAYNCIMRNDAHSAKCIDSPSNYVKVNAQKSNVMVAVRSTWLTAWLIARGWHLMRGSSRAGWVGTT